MNQNEIAELKNGTCPMCNGPAEGFTEVEIVSDPRGWVCVVGYNPNMDAVFVIWRGTAQLINWITNFKVIQLPWLWSKPFDWVHRGFMNAVDTLQDGIETEVRAIKQRHPSAKVYFTGHSLGGACCELSALRMMENIKTWDDGSPAVTQVYSVAAPLVGNYGFARYYNEVFPKLVRLVNRYDPVPLIPRTWWGYVRFGREFFMSQEGDTASSGDEDKHISVEEDLKQIAHALEENSKTDSENPLCLNPTYAYCPHWEYGNCEKSERVLESNVPYHDLSLYLCRFKTLFNIQ
eukprot:Nk52_evm1s638 gene=Nk52_evmTU1s638